MTTVLILAGLGVFSLCGVIFDLRRSMTVVILAGLLAAFIFSLVGPKTGVYHYNNTLYFDQYVYAFDALVCGLAIVWFIAFEKDLSTDQHRIEKFALILFSLVGGLLMITYNHMVILFLGIEILSIPLYVLAASHQKDSLSIEAGLKYFLMGSFATAFLLLGMALIYGATGSFQINQISEVVTSGRISLPGLFQSGLGLMILGLCFKVSAVPFHFWTPDVYEGSPTMFTAYMSTVVKVAAFAGFGKLFMVQAAGIQGQNQLLILICCILTLSVGNLMAIYPESAKRMLAYSGIAQAGYLLIPLLGIPTESFAILFYGLTAYAIAAISLFMVVYTLEKNYGPVTIATFEGLARSNPYLAASISISLISLAGIPPMAGFMGKYFIFNQAIADGYLPLVVFGLFTSLVGIYYYFRIIIAMYFRPAVLQRPVIQPPVLIVTGILSFLLILLGVFPDLLFR